MPQQQSYGYTGQGVKKQSKVPMMMAAGAGLAAGAVIGAGSYYAYQQMSRGNWYGDHRDRSWCEPNDVPGQTMLCDDCNRKYWNDCRPISGCYQSRGSCSYTIPEDTVRDDVMTAGFVPGDSPSPWTVTITSITGPGDTWTQDAICPADQPDTNNFDDTWTKASSVNIGLYMTLTEMDPMDPQVEPQAPEQNTNTNTNTNQDLDASAGYRSGTYAPHQVLIFFFACFICSRRR